jgi:hypothetical protein
MGGVMPNDNNFSPEFDQIFDTFDQLLNIPTPQLEASENALDALLSTLLEKDSSYLRDYYTEALKRAKDTVVEAAKPLSQFEQDVNKAVANLFHPDREHLVRCILKNQEMYANDTRGAGSNNCPSALKSMSVQGITNVVDSMIGPDLIGVQPMSGPVGLIYSLQYRYRPLEQVDNNKESLEEALKAILEGTTEKKLSLDIISAAIEACTRKCSPYWTVEAMADLKHHGIDIESELRSALSHEFAVEFDGEILHDLRKLGDMGDGVSSIDIEQEDLEPGNYQKLRIKLGCGITRACSLIARQTRRGAGNWIVVSPVVLTLLQMTKDFVMTKTTSPRMAGRMQVGILQSSIIVYVDSYAPDNNILVGYKGGNGETDAGYVWAPYVLLMSGGVVVNAKTFQLQSRFMTRYGKYIIARDDEFTLGSGESYYQTVEVNLPKNFLGEDEEDEAVSEGVLTCGDSDNVTHGSQVKDFSGYADSSNRGSKVETLEGTLPGLEFFNDPIMRSPTRAATADEITMLGDSDELYNPPHNQKDFFINNEEEE